MPLTAAGTAYDLTTAFAFDGGTRRRHERVADDAPRPGSGQGADTAAAADTLRRARGPSAGRTDTLTALDNDPVIVATERRLRSALRSTFDVYPCGPPTSPAPTRRRCTRKWSPLYQGGKTPEQIIQVFVDREGEGSLMAPPAEGSTWPATWCRGW